MKTELKSKKSRLNFERYNIHFVHLIPLSLLNAAGGVIFTQVRGLSRKTQVELYREVLYLPQ